MTINTDWKKVESDSDRGQWPAGLKPGHDHFRLTVDYVHRGTMSASAGKLTTNACPPPAELLAHVGKARAAVNRLDDIVSILQEAAKGDSITARFAAGILADIQQAPAAQPHASLLEGVLP